MKKNKILWYLLMLIFILLFCVSAYMIGSYVWDSHQEEASFEELAKLLEQASLEEASLEDGFVQESSDESDQSGASGESSGDGTSADGADKSAAEGQSGKGYALLHQQNPDMFGWIRIADTRVNYPVMHTPNDPEYYLRRGFDKKSSRGGVPFMEATCFTGCGNYLIYGHNMKNGTMFNTILSYAKKSFWEEHPVIEFDTLSESGEYEIISAFYTQIYPAEVQDVFRYYWYIDLTEQADFEEYVEQVKAHSLYDTGVEAQYGDELITLSTCSYHVEDGRFVVVARKAAVQE